MSSRPPDVAHTVIIGATGGVGKLVAESLAAKGTTVSTVGRTRLEWRSGFHAIESNLATVDWDRVYADAEKATAQPIDAIVYVAGDATFGRASAIPVDRARRLFEANFWGPTRAATAAQTMWAEPRRGCFVSISSLSARRAVPFEAHYCASKAATARFLDALGLEHPDGRLRFVSLYPGRLRTGFRAKADWYGLVPQGDPLDGGDPQKVADVVLAQLSGKATSLVLGAREKAIDLADRLNPALYDRLVLRRRVRSILSKQRKS